LQRVQIGEQAQLGEGALFQAAMYNSPKEVQPFVEGVRSGEQGDGPSTGGTPGRSPSLLAEDDHRNMSPLDEIIALDDADGNGGGGEAYAQKAGGNARAAMSQLPARWNAATGGTGARLR